MSYNTDSDGAAVIEKPLKLCPKLNNPRKQIGRTPQVSFNSIADQCYISEIENMQNKNTDIKQPEIASIIEPLAKTKYLEIPYGNPTNFLLRSNSEEVEEQGENISVLSEVPNTLGSPQLKYEFGPRVLDKNENIESFEESNSSSILENQRILIGNQNKIIDELAKVKTMLSVLLENQTKNDNINILKAIPSEQKETVSKSLPINSFEKLEELELILSNKKLQQKLVDEKSLVCGTSGKRNGQSCCYSLVDNFFQRNFLMKCSWAGGSRDKNRKIAFKSFNQIINTFFQIIHLADKEFSVKDCENFFKCVIKNARRRAFSLEAPQKKRSSASKSRPSNLEYKKLKENLEKLPPEQMETDTGVSDNEADEPELPNEDSEDSN